MWILNSLDAVRCLCTNNGKELRKWYRSNVELVKCNVPVEFVAPRRRQPAKLGCDIPHVDTSLPTARRRTAEKFRCPKLFPYHSMPYTKLTTSYGNSNLYEFVEKAQVTRLISEVLSKPILWTSFPNTISPLYVLYRSYKRLNIITDERQSTCNR